MKARALLAIALLAFAGIPALGTGEGFERATRIRAFTFPSDHAAHPGYRTEWWYYTGIVSSGKREFGYELTFFRVALAPSLRARASHWATRDVLFAHFAVTDVSAKRFFYDQRVGRPVLGLAGYSADKLDVFIGPDGSAGQWSVRQSGEAMRLRASANGHEIDLTLRAKRPPVLNGRDGLSQKGPGAGNANYYYSVPRLVTRGSLSVQGKRYSVSGMTWMDHEWGTSELAPNQKGWDWFSLRLSDGSDLMLYSLRDARSRPTPYSSGTIVRSDGTTLSLSQKDFSIRANGHWKSPRTGGLYPSGWTLMAPKEKLRLSVTPLLKDQELVTAGTTGVSYWEGAVRAEGSHAGRSVSGEGYVELTGYAGGAPGKALPGR
ncbi:MAG: carotenoid 1,2-hydratase [Armatimonadetes bacterium]|nr:carotenoid 1,2-hydratase [Armatimonadota bacterium]